MFKDFPRLFFHRAREWFGLKNRVFVSKFHALCDNMSDQVARAKEEKCDRKGQETVFYLFIF